MASGAGDTKDSGIPIDDPPITDAPAHNAPARGRTPAEESAPLENKSRATGQDEDYTIQQKSSEAAAEGHDADIPSNIGYVLDEKGEELRKQSIARQRSASLANRPSHESGDVEKAAGINGEKAGESPSEDEANVVWWDGPDDPMNPLNWPRWRTILNCGLISGLTFITPLASCKSPPTPDHSPT